jgi:hypothetical protein
MFGHNKKLSESTMSCWLFVATIAAVLFAEALLRLSWAQTQAELPYPQQTEIIYQWSYSCPTSKCGFTCEGGRNATHVTKLNLYLGNISIGSNRNAFALFYDFATEQFPRANGFIVNTGLGALSCQVYGMSLDYSGPPKSNLPKSNLSN